MTEIERLDELTAFQFANLRPEIKAALEAASEGYETCVDSPCVACDALDDLNAAIRREMGEPEGGS